MKFKSKKYSIESTDYQVGQDNIFKWGMDVHNTVFSVSVGLSILFIVALLVFPPADAKAAIDAVKGAALSHFDFVFMWTANIMLICAIGIAFSPLGKIRLGGDNATTDYSTISWVSMLFAAGMGIGLIFWGVAEPTAFYTDWFGTPLDVAPFTPEGRELALGASVFHWGFHAWAIYGMTALSLAYFVYNKGLPLSMRSVFYPILGDKVWGKTGDVIDIMAVLVILFGLATSLGLGGSQAASGISHVFGFENSIFLQLTIILVIMGLAILSVVRGMDGGVKLLSNINMVIAFIFLGFISILNFTTVLDSLVTGVVGYVKNIIPLSQNSGREDTSWLHGWTVFYWAWWIAYAPFFGMFVARISRGRTVREFLACVLIIPTLVTTAWMSFFGGIAIQQIIDKVGQLGVEQGITDVSLSLFYMLDAYPMGDILSIIAVLLIIVFFVTTLDSGSIVVDSMTAGGKLELPMKQKIVWAVISALIAMVMLWIGGTDSIKALQSVTIIAALPFAIILVLACVSLVLGMFTEVKKPQLNRNQSA
ncbi:BCCT family transporter [Shewanella inventionis]|uniref:BCCT family transporter n=1 Tax=Shewanella inventionis TaxID=1738770 RepID=A0ABQ1J4B7_9GAMM|nr:BCCT family transporter [Shewanella inventionis]MCL1157600.1 BCCT family transporter [Shewanella inventionis]GGB59277.1 BCCT family transporter [Shewanella inventionis]